MSLLGSRSAKKDKKETKEPKVKEKKEKKEKKKPAAAPSSTSASAPGRGVVVEKTKPDIYTAMLVLSFVAIVIGCICLYLELNVYNFETKAAFLSAWLTTSTRRTDFFEYRGFLNIA